MCYCTGQLQRTTSWQAKGQNVLFNTMSNVAPNIDAQLVTDLIHIDDGDWEKIAELRREYTKTPSHTLNAHMLKHATPTPHTSYLSLEHEDT